VGTVRDEIARLLSGESTARIGKNVFWVSAGITLVSLALVELFNWEFPHNRGVPYVPIVLGATLLLFGAYALISTIALKLPKRRRVQKRRSKPVQRRDGPRI